MRGARIRAGGRTGGRTGGRASAVKVFWGESVLRGKNMVCHFLHDDRMHKHEFYWKIGWK